MTILTRSILLMLALALGACGVRGALVPPDEIEDEDGYEETQDESPRFPPPEPVQ